MDRSAISIYDREPPRNRPASRASAVNALNPAASDKYRHTPESIKLSREQLAELVTSEQARLDDFLQRDRFAGIARVTTKKITAAILRGQQYIYFGRIARYRTGHVVAWLAGKDRPVEELLVRGELRIKRESVETRTRPPAALPRGARYLPKGEC